MTQLFGQRKVPKAPYVAPMLGWLIWGEGQPIVQRVREWITHLLHAWERKLEAGKPLNSLRPSILQELFQLRVCRASACVFRYMSFYPKAKKISRLWRIKMQALITDQNRSILYTGAVLEKTMTDVSWRKNFILLHLFSTTLNEMIIHKWCFQDLHSQIFFDFFLNVWISRCIGGHELYRSGLLFFRNPFPFYDGQLKPSLWIESNFHSCAVQMAQKLLWQKFRCYYYALERKHRGKTINLLSVLSWFFFAGVSFDF